MHFNTATPIIGLEQLRLLCIGFAVASALPLLLGPLCFKEIWSPRLTYLLIAAQTLIGIGIAINLSGYCTPPDGSWTDPNLGPWTDSSREWDWLNYYLATGKYSAHSNTGYTLLTSWLVKLFGGIWAPLLLNMVFTSVTIIATADLTATLLPAADKKRSGFIGALAVASVASIIWYATIYLKDAAATTAFTLMALGLARLLKSQFTTKTIVAPAIGALLLLLVKSPLALLLIGGIVIITIPSMPAAIKQRRKLSLVIYLLLICVAALAGGRHFRPGDNIENMAAESPVDNTGVDYMLGYDTVQRYGELIPGYFTSPISHRIAMLPLTATAQYFPPFPWNFTRDKQLGKFVWYAHIALPWYLLGGAFIGFIIFCMGRKKRSASLSRWALWLIACWLGIALYSGGTVARYYLPLIPAIVPPALQFINCARTRLIAPRSALIYTAAYTVCLLAALTAAYIFLKT